MSFLLLILSVLIHNLSAAIEFSSYFQGKHRDKTSLKENFSLQIAKQKLFPCSMIS